MSVPITHTVEVEGGQIHGIDPERKGLVDWQAVGRALAGVPEPVVNPDPYGIEERKRRRAGK